MLLRTPDPRSCLHGASGSPTSRGSHPGPSSRAAASHPPAPCGPSPMAARGRTASPKPVSPSALHAPRDPTSVGGRKSQRLQPRCALRTPVPGPLARRGLGVLSPRWFQPPWPPRCPLENPALSPGPAVPTAWDALLGDLCQAYSLARLDSAELHPPRPLQPGRKRGCRWAGMSPAGQKGLFTAVSRVLRPRLACVGSHKCRELMNERGPRV